MSSLVETLPIETPLKKIDLEFSEAYTSNRFG